MPTENMSEDWKKTRSNGRKEFVVCSFGPLLDFFGGTKPTSLSNALAVSVPCFSTKSRNQYLALSSVIFPFWNLCYFVVLTSKLHRPTFHVVILECLISCFKKQYFILLTNPVFRTHSYILPL
jgi:hypothetical protein